jgi:hypothetical protein
MHITFDESTKGGPCCHIPGSLSPAQIELAIQALNHRLKEMLAYRKDGDFGQGSDECVPEYHQFETGARRSEVIGPRYDLIPEGPLRRLALRYTLGATKYGEWNWQKGLPLSDTFNHIIEHLLKAKREILAGQMYNDDDLAGAAWGIFTLMFFQDRGDYSKGNLRQLLGVEQHPQWDNPRLHPDAIAGLDAQRAETEPEHRARREREMKAEQQRMARNYNLPDPRD